VDFKKAFDLVWHDGLLLKILEMGIGGNMYGLLKNMFRNLNLRIKTSKGMSPLIKSNSGVSQGDGICPLLFNICINDLPTNFLREECQLPFLNSERVPGLLYADDLILFSETPSGLQKCLDILQNYCNKWKLTVNASKTKTMVMHNGKNITNSHFYFNGEEIMNTDHYKYLGTIISSKGNFKLAKEDLRTKGLKAFFSMWRSLYTNKSPPFSIATKLFDALIKPILTYNSDVWGDEIPPSLQKLITKETLINHEEKHLKFINESPFEKGPH